MDPFSTTHEAETAGAVIRASVQPSDGTFPSLPEVLTSDVILDLLALPKDGLLRIKGALLFLAEDDLFAYSWTDSQGRSHSKLLPSDAVHAAFHPVSFDSGWMPPGTLRSGVNRAGLPWISLAIPPARRRLTILDNDLGLLRLEVPLPGCVFTGCGRNYWVWAVREAEVTPQSVLYHAPFSNVGGSGSICFGANRPPEASATTILPAFQLFLESPFNGHLANHKSRRHLGDIRYLLRELAETHATEFPLDDLFQMERGSTLESYLPTVLHNT